MNQQLRLVEISPPEETPTYLSDDQMGVVLLAWLYGCNCPESVFVEAYNRHHKCLQDDLSARWQRHDAKKFVSTGVLPPYVKEEIALLRI